MVALTELNVDNYMRAEWYLYGGSSGYLRNVATNNIYYNSTTKYTSGSKTSLWFAYDNNGKYYISYTPNTGYPKYLQYRNGSVQFYDNTTGTTSWQLCTVNTSIDYGEDNLFEPKQITEQISVIDGEGIAKPMTEIRRNSHISIVLNVYYDETTGGFRFDVEPWQRVNVDWTFE
jgi:hypothetical protein